ncbi:ankyrin repeat-containing domain protein [Mycena rebaudengoi]|nr:ankyrin repeat-containing domain protein [Mycena rebaudengoi]
MKPATNAKTNSGWAPDSESEDTPPSCLRAVWNKLSIHSRKRARKNKKGQRAQDTSQEATSTQNGLPNPPENTSQRPETGDSSASASKPPAQTVAAKESIDTSGEVMANERNPRANAAKRPEGDHASTSGQPAQTTGAKDTITSNLLAVLDIVQQVGKILQTVPLVEPIGAILSQAVKVYKEVDDNSEKRDAFLARATALHGGIKQAILWLEKSDNVGNLESDVDGYTKKLEEVRAVLAVHRGKFSQVIHRGKLAAELALVDQSLNDFSKLFETKCLIRIERGIARTNHTLTDMQQTQGGMARDVDAVLEFVTKTDRKEIIDWLSPANFFLQQEAIFGRRQAGTGEWLLEDDRFKQWKTGSGEILWGRGAPGAGKTVLASIVVDHLVESHADDNIGVACIYLNHKETHEQTTSNLLAGVWRQLVLGKPIASTSLVCKLFNEHSEKRTKPELAQIHEIVRLAIAEWSRVYIVVDALDETPEDNRHRLLKYLTNLGPAVCLMLTSRHDVSLQNITTERFDICVPEEDIQKYVEHQINESTQLSLYVGTCSQLREEIIAKILENADRMFLLAKLHIESLAACTTIATIRERLEKLSSNLELAYSQAMERIDIQTEERKKLAYSTLTWVTTAMRPLKVTELQEALAVEWGAKERNPEKRPELKIILSVCVGLVIVDEESSVVRFVHATTQVYFDGQFPGAHADITRTLLTYMAFNEVQVTLGKDMRARLKDKHTLIEYCNNCLVHAQNVRQPETQLWELIMDFLEQAVAWHSFWRYSEEPCPWNYPSWPKAPSPLWVAAAANLQEIVQYLLDGGISPDSGQIQDDSPLCAASFYGHLQTAKLLLEAGASVNVDSGHACSALEAASGRGHIDIVHLLLEKGADIHAGHNRALLEASWNGHANVLQVLFEKGANVDAGHGEASPLEAASQNGHIDIVHLLFKNGADVHIGNDSALRAAAESGHTEVVQLLLRKGANANATSGNGESLLITMSAKEYIQLERRLNIVRLLLENGADLNAGNNGALRAASKAGRTEVVQLLLEHGANINALGEDNVSALEAAACWHPFDRLMSFPVVFLDSEDKRRRRKMEETTHRLQLVRLLLDKGADVHARDNGALRVASMAGHTEVIQLLLEHGANVNPADKYASSALEAAASWDGNPFINSRDSEDKRRRKMGEATTRRLQLVRLLLDKGVNVHARNNGALQVASMAGHTEVIQLLLEHGANVNPADEYASSALEAAASWDGNPFINSRDSEDEKRRKMAEAATRRLTHIRFLLDNGHIEVVQLLLENGTNINTADELGGSVLEAAACWYGNPSINFKDSEDKKRRKMAEAATRRLELIRLLLDNGADVHARNNGALRAAAEAGNTEVVQPLLENGANINAADEHTRSALEAAASWDGNPLISSWDSEDEKRRKKAEAATRRLTHVRFLLNNGADVHARNNGALREAAKAGNTEVIQLLLEHGANVNPADEYASSALEAAASWDGNPFINSRDSEDKQRMKMAEAATCRLTHVRFLLDNGADVHAGNNGALRAAAKAGNTEVIQLLLENGANINTAGEDTASALEAAASWDGNPFIDSGDSWDEKISKMAEAATRRLTHVRFLLDNGADVHARNNGALRAASKRGYTEVMQLLLKNGAKINAVNEHTGSALEAAASWDGNPDQADFWDSEDKKRKKKAEAAMRRLTHVRLLLDKGADIHAGNNGALREAAKAGHTEVVQLLLENGANINAADEHTASALEAAASWDGSPIPTNRQDSEDEKRRKLAEARLTHVRFLLDNGADVHARNDGALREAAKAGNTEIVQLLLENGVNINAADEDTASALEAAACWDGSPNPLSLWDSEDYKIRKMGEAAMRRLTHVRFLLDNGADVHAGNNGALREAAKAGNTEVIQLLLENGANINAADKQTGSALEAAASWDGSPIQLSPRLLAYRSVDQRDLMIVKRAMAEATARRLTHVRFLLDHGADIHAGNNGALRAAHKAGNPEVERLLLEYGADALKNAEMESQQNVEPEVEPESQNAETERA